MLQTITPHMFFKGSAAVERPPDAKSNLAMLVTDLPRDVATCVPAGPEQAENTPPPDGC